MGSARPGLAWLGSKVQDATGLRIDDEHVDNLARAVAKRAAERSGGDVGAYVEMLREAGAGDEELVRLAAELSVGETHFFRQREHWDALSGRVLPERIAARGGTRGLRLISAGCATGEEAYSLAIALTQVAGGRVDGTPVVGVDLNDGFLDHARAARYSAWSLRGVPDEDRERWFARCGEQYLLQTSVRRAVDLRRANLHAPGESLWAPDTYDVVFLRNVVMYHTEEATRRLVSRVARSLVPGGYLFLGHAETLRGVTDALHLVRSHGAFYYQRPGPGAQPGDWLEEAGVGTEVLDDGAAGRSDWASAISRSARRIESLERSGPRGAVRVEPPRASRADRVRAATLLVHQKRYREAEEVLRCLASERGEEGDVLLLEAAVAVFGRSTGRARGALRRLLAADELSPDAWYLLASSHERDGDTQAALEANRTAIYLDERFAAPHHLAARLARGRGDPEATRRALERAIDLLPGEQERRILLFGGGFDRSTLERVCRRELARLEEGKT